MSERESKVESRKLKVTQALRALSTRVSNFAFRFSNLLACIPWRIVLGGAGVLFVAIWLLEHDAGLRREVEFGQLKQQTAAQVTELRARADAALRAANEENARAIESLEARRRRLEREAEQLRQRLVSLREEERARVGQVATLPASELEQRVAARLDPGNFATRDSGFGPPVPSPESRVPSPDFVLTEEGARRVETAFLELEACRGQSAVKDGALGNCQEQVATQAAIAGEMRKSLDDLNQAIRLKDEIAAGTETLHRAELRAARGSWGSHFLRAVEYVGLGVVIGLVAR
jgi:hypothetical protein